MRRRVRRLRSLTRAQWRVVVIALPLVPTVQLLVRHRGFMRTANMLARRSNGQAAQADLEFAYSAGEAVTLVAARPLIGASCLGRSLVLWFLLRRRGIDADLVIGANRMRGGLPAHAWVEVDGMPVNDVSTVRDRFGSFELSLPRLAGTK